jgi:hypothetical protein
MSAVSDVLKNANLTPQQIAGTPASIISKEFVDPLKQNVATPLSSMLVSNLTSGIPRYTAPTAADFSSVETGNINSFLSQDANANFKMNIEDPTLANFRNILLPDIREGYAGALSSSGRTSGETNAAVTLSSDLAKQKSQYGLDFTKAQIDAATALQTAQTIPLMAAYKSWIDQQTLSDTELKNALTFLSSTTGTGTTVATALDPGTAGLYGQAFGAAVANESMTNASTPTYTDAKGNPLTLQEWLNL